VDFALGVEELCRGLTFLGQEVGSAYPERDVPGGEELIQLSHDDGFELDDTVLELEITPNRPDCLSVVGIARELSFLVGQPLRTKKKELSEAGRAVETAAALEVRETGACPRYIGRVITGITVCESPVWLKRRLLAVGLRPINAVVDFSNYFMLETGQPLHCFDLDKLSDRTVVVRFAREGERIVTLDEEERELCADTLVIADSRKPIAIAGIMGGIDSAIGRSTVNVFLECAHFDPLLLRRASRRLALSTDSSYRFERGVDLCDMERISRGAASQIAELCGGSILAGALESYPVPYRTRSLRLRPKRVNRILGTDMDSHAMEKILLSLGFVIGKNTEDDEADLMWVEPPSFRSDVEREEDLVEEIARAYGYDRIPQKMPTTLLSSGRLHKELKLQRSVKETLQSLGLCEAWTLSLVGDELLDRCRVPEGDALRAGVRLMNPLSGDQDMLRTFMLPCLLSCASHSARRNELDRWLFGLGNVFIDRGEERPEERMRLCIVGCGDPLPANWARQEGKGGFYHIKGIVERTLDGLDLPAPTIEPNNTLPFAAPNEAFELRLGPKPIGFLGKLHPEVSLSFDLPDVCFFAELELGNLRERVAPVRGYEQYSPYPAVILDLAITLKKGTQHREVESVVREIGGDLMENVALFDRYEGKQIPSDRVGLAYSITYRAKDRTLTVSEAFGRHQEIIDALSRRLDARLRQ